PLWVGVCPGGSFHREGATFWKPLTFAPEQRTRNYHWLGAIGRLKAGVTLDQARAEMRAVAASLADPQPAFKRDWGIALDPLADQLLAGSLKRSIPVAFGAVG